ncbi:MULTISPECIES: fumarylacetoacetate hydrolase family protein [unclassified Streptomyces]|uniref:fumarylacetoacetate hydrolase family protein n=1 Tax=unclassified Streptomyces TaxID=2593676 RepID=UPI00070B37D3|nr:MULTISPECIES: fumarylacetoacetate hydrolase family protein [unclassified Streptomyces]KRD19967.1 hydroxylase [Streptomyces sp. Root264]
MRFATYEHRGRRRCGVVDGAAVRPFPDGTTLLGLIHSGLPRAATELAALSDPVSLDAVRLLPPLEPPSVRDFVTFEEHIEGVRRSRERTQDVPEAWYDAPTFYFTNPHALIGAHDDVPYPPGSRLLDFELEVAVVIGREGRDLTPEQARDHIAGYTLFNDWSARDLQIREMQVGLGPCKGKDTATTLGPYLVTPDEVEPYRDADGFLRLALTSEINGEVVGKDLLSNMSWTFEEMVAYASRGAVVRPGDVLGSGTCGNGGCLAELWSIRGERVPPPLKPGDTVTLTADVLGSVRNTVVPGPEPVPLPTGRRRPRSRP